MDSFMQEFFATYGLPLLYALITAIAGIIAKGVANVYNKYADSREKRAVARTVVLATEQIYNDLHGEEKFNKALLALIEMLAERGIKVAELEARMLIEAAVGEFNDVFEKNVQPLEN
jgi:intergrase/recombinase